MYLSNNWTDLLFFLNLIPLDTLNKWIEVDYNWNLLFNLYSIVHF